MVSTAWLGNRFVRLTGLDKLRRTVLFPSASVSSIRTILADLLVSPGRKLSTTLVGRKSTPGRAVPGLAVNVTEPEPELPVARVTVMEAKPSFSLLVL